MSELSSLMTSVRGLEIVARLRDAVRENPLAADIINVHAQFFRDSEQKLISYLRGEEPPDEAPGEAEFGRVLFLLHHHARLVESSGEELGLPESRFQLAAPAAAATDTSLLPRVTGDGQIIGFGKWETFDVDWLEAAGNYLLVKVGKIKKYPFQTNAARIKMKSATGGPIKIVLVGDWGTGKWDDGTTSGPALAVMQQIAALKPDYTVHLGDVYYSGTQAEETDNYVPFWAPGSGVSFMLNSNHEMYDGANGYFDIGLKDPAFAAQQCTSYFALETDDIVIFGLDSAYYDPSLMFMGGALPQSGAQANFIQQVGIDGRKVVILTHHNGYNTFGTQILGIYHDAAGILGGRYPDYWYWGHQHNGVVYNKSADNVLARCTGHGAIPFANGKQIPGPNVAWYANTPDPTAPPAGMRVMNGFTLLTIDGSTITEQWFNQTGAQEWP